jgi:hypothetical protein
MKKISFALSAIVVTTFFVSCKKESNSPAVGDITGEYTFVSMEANTSSTAESSGMKTVTTSNYTTENNTGTVTIGASTITSSNVSYDINTTLHGTTYLNGTLLGTVDQSYSFAAPATSASATYRLVGADSIYFENGTMFSDGITSSTEPAGARLSVDGNILYMLTTVHQNITQDIGGELISIDESATQKIKLQRK